ncbi:unnamed protein product [Dicrocoelium dendriticum]|nr:unnamed protein product [Dicrocoelium dendriticum]
MYPADKSNHANADTDIGPGTFALHSEPSLESYCNMDSWSEPGSEDLVFRPVMRRRRAQPPRGKLRCGTQYWNRNLSNADDQLDTAEVTEDAVDLERLQREKVLEAMSRTSWWLWPFAQFFRLLGTIFCTYKIEIGLRGKLRKALGDPTKMLRQNIYGLFIGILMGFGAYLLFLLTFSNNPRLSTLLSAYFMLVSVFGIAFSEDFRCIALLTVPYLAASRLDSLIDGLNQTIDRLRDTLRKINFAMFKVTRVMEQQSSWIASLVEACGDPVALKNQCLSFLNNIYFNCKASMGIFDFVCGLVRQFAADTCGGDIAMNKVCQRQKELLDDKLEIDSTTDLDRKMNDILKLVGETNLSLQGDFDEYQKMIIESDDSVISLLQQRMDAFINTVEHGKYILSWILVIWTLLTMLQLVIQAAIFRKKWIVRDTFDNVYITAAFVAQEKRAVSQGLIATVPLIGTETWEYKKLSSFTWTNSEKRKAFRSFVILFMWMTTLLVVLFADYVMYEVLTTITPVFSEEFSTFGAKSSMGDDYLSAEAGASAPRITGTSSYANVVRALLGMLNPIKDVALNVDAAACKPTATPPNAKTNGSVVIMLVFTLLSIFFEVYVLRLRHLILIWYYPNRGMQRAAWLRTHIRNNRGLFHRLIHKMRTVDVKPGRQAPKTTRLGRMMNRSPWFRRFMQFFGIKRVMCSYCGEEGNPSKKAVFEDNFSRCVECGGYYCRVCQVDLDNICMICRTPLFALSVEVDFEQFSSDEEFDAICARYLRRAEQTTIRARKNQSGGERSRISIKRRA